ncbi:hypothetical protein TTRE_0000325201 [Trichuris trichiura]|uniref:Uncharacterized protein n=1 Tax=Trichuris trichiura TaxID=36087 RepID=A0A077Z396_TRITR|nr:hypothetical protein TTRE_0000325201 [Trichuris trichiura]
MLRHQYAGLPTSGGDLPLSRSSVLQLSWRRKAQEAPSMSGYNSCCYLNSTHLDNVSVNRWSPMTFEDDDQSHLPYQADGVRRSLSANKGLKNCVLGSAARSDSAATVLIGPNPTKADRQLRADSVRKSDRSVAPCSLQGAISTPSANSSTNLVAIILTLTVLGLPSIIVTILSLMLYLHVASETYAIETSPSEEFAIIGSKNRGSSVYTEPPRPLLNDRTQLELASALCAVSLSMALCAAFSAITECYVILKSVQAHGTRTRSHIIGYDEIRLNETSSSFLE